MKMAPYSAEDFGKNPLMFYYEVTRACDLQCRHCRASAQHEAAPDELTREQSFQLIEQVASFPRKPNMCFTGGDPLKREDIFELLSFAVSKGITTALTPSATPLATFDAFKKAKEAGVSAIGISLDGMDAQTHDSFRGFEGSFAQTLDMLRFARELNFPVQINTSITKRNFRQIDQIAELLEKQGIATWSVFFLVPVGRGVEEQRIEPEDYRWVFSRLWEHSKNRSFSIRTTEAPFYRRFVLEQGGNPFAPPKRHSEFADAMRREEPSGHGNLFSAGHGHPRSGQTPLGITDGRGIMFVAHNGVIFPAGFLPLECGKFPDVSVVDTYQKHPIFKKLQDPDQYHGICGTCSERHICGGSRARAYALTGDYLGPEPDCFFEGPMERTLSVLH
ncbi:MAG: TIGR04053 family radical SAM/SPASM domain-containing protein [Planctomycetaceae bacterium]|nr:TIGR04053 family radical SAM/SPASM domain-containing protein [Planctomycetaceae bacterium]